MKKFLLATAALVSLIGGSPAGAADWAPVVKAPPPVVLGWTGFYAGFTVGGTWGKFDPTGSTVADGYLPIPVDLAAVNAAGIQNLKSTSLTGGIELGYNWQSGSFVAGFEIDAQAMRLGGTVINGGTYPIPPIGYTFAFTTSINSNWLFTARPRIGFANDNWLVYATGGLAVTDLSGSFLWGDVAGAQESAVFNQIRAGYAVGAGVEANIWNHWSVKAEYLYVNFGTVTTTGSMALQGLPGQVFTHSADLRASIGRVGLNYHFGSHGSAGAADLAVKAPPVLWSWAGFYIGGHIGGAMGLNNVADPLGPSIFGDQIHSPGYFGGAQIGYNWQAPGSNWVFGLEADASLANLDGTNTCYAFNAQFTSFNCRAHTDAFGSFTGRIGWAFGQNGRALWYVKSGAAWAHSNVDMIGNFDFGTGLVAGQTATTSFTAWGGTVGIGAEYAMTAHWTVKAEYDYMNFGKPSVAAVSPSMSTTPAGVVTFPFAVPGTTVAQQIHAMKLGVNYKFGPDAVPFGDANPTKAPVYKVAPVVAWAPGWQVEGGLRYWYSSGRFQKDLAPGNLGPQNPTLNISRLTWDNLPGHTGELFARVDTPWNFFVKGFVGGGAISSGGKINDEDWGLPAGFVPVNTGYTNTVGNASGTLAYGTFDVGYDAFRGAGYKVGVFVGYNIYTDNKTSTSCTQIAFPASGICDPPFDVFILSQNDKWQSLRVGANAEVMLTPQLKMVADVAFLPYVDRKGQDFHALRPFLAEEYGRGIGTQLEAFLYYYLTPQFSLGAGGRYWAMWTTSGGACREPPNGACPAQVQDMQFKTERFGVLLQAAYRWDEPAAIKAKY